MTQVSYILHVFPGVEEKGGPEKTHIVHSDV